MKRRVALLLAVLLAVALSGPKVGAAEKKTYTKPEDAGIDYKLQGEYTGTAGSEKWGAQVIAMGDGKFHAVFEPGGLPGDGWDAKTRYESQGKLDGDKVAFESTDKVAWEEGHIAPPVEIEKGFN